MLEDIKTMLTLLNSNHYQSQIINSEGSLAVVLQEAHGQKPKCFNKDILELFRPFLDRLNGIYCISDSEDAKIKDLRLGWSRVQQELSIFGPKVKRVLLMGCTQMMRVVVPGVPGDLQDCHGTIFSLPPYEVVPTWTIKEYQLKHMKFWVERDLLRFEKLSKPKLPLNYGSYKDLPQPLNTVAIDLETTGLDSSTDTIQQIWVQWGDTQRVCIENHFEETIQRLSQAKELIFHNAHFDLQFLGQEFRHRTYGKIRDTLMMARARGELVGSLKHLGNCYTNRPGNYAWHQAGLDHQFTDKSYGAEDVDVTWKLYHLWEKDQTLVIEIMNKAQSVFADQTVNGTFIDIETLGTIQEQGLQYLQSTKQELTEKYEVDPGHQEELCQVLINRGYQLNKKTKSGEEALTAQVLEELGLYDILEYRRAQKLDSAFISKMKNLLRLNRTIPHHQSALDARTGRTTMTSFNWQQLPRKGPGKKLVISRFENGMILNCDLQAAEVRLACWISGDKKLAHTLNSKDIHTENAARGLKKDPKDITEDERYDAKSMIFRSIFGGSPQNEQQKRIHTYMVQEFFDLFQWIQKQKKIGQSQFKVTDPLGKVTNMLQKLDYAGKWACGRLGINAPIQGSQSHIAIWLTCRVWELLKNYQSLVLFGVHDSMLIDCHPTEVEIVIRAIKQAFKELHKTFISIFPIMNILPMIGEVQVGHSWADCKVAQKIIISSHGDTK